MTRVVLTRPLRIRPAGAGWRWRSSDRSPLSQSEVARPRRIVVNTVLKEIPAGKVRNPPPFETFLGTARYDRRRPL